MGLGDKATALTLAEHAMAANPIEKDAIDGPIPIEVLARVAAQIGEADRAIAALQKLLSIPYDGALASGVPLTPALLRSSDSIRCSIRFGMIRALKNSSPQLCRKRRKNNAPLKRGNSDCQESFCRVEAAQGCTAAETCPQTSEGFFS
jgi:hypothetical protein